MLSEPTKRDITDFFITLNDYFQTHFVAPALTWCNMVIRISVCSSVRSCVRQAINICDQPSVYPLMFKFISAREIIIGIDVNIEIAT